ncbi:MAG TPA: response regulator [Cytophagales bacterium]|nr:response regulator [Cytophagales bacterium]
MEVRKLLLLDDDELSNLLIGSIIEDVRAIKNYKIENNGWNALEYLKECDLKNNFPDLMLVDLKMPEMDGFDFIERYEAAYWKKYPKTKVMILTSSRLEKDKEKAMVFKSVCRFIYKPLTEEKLMEIVEMAD